MCEEGEGGNGGAGGGRGVDRSCVEGCGNAACQGLDF